MTLGGQFDRSTAPGVFGAAADPLWVEEYGYGLGPPTGIRILKYASAGALEISRSRSDFVHQLYWTPDGMLSVRHANRTEFIGNKEALWVRRGVTHEVFASRKQYVYRVCLREIPAKLHDLRAAAVSTTLQARRLIEQLANPGHDEGEALAARVLIMGGLGETTRDLMGTDPISTPADRTAGFAGTVAGTLMHDPSDQTRLDEWAARLHTSTKTLQRDFVRTFGMSFSQWRTKIRLEAAVVLLESGSVTEVAHLVGYASLPAFVSAFAREYGHTPGRFVTEMTNTA